MSSPRRNSDSFSDEEFGDFIIRRRVLPGWQLLLLFVLSFTLLYVAATNGELLGGNFGIALAIFAVIGPLTWFTVYFSQQNRDMLLAAEFQNALFSAAARLKTRFVIIVKRDGTIFYYDRGFQEVFPETSNRGTLMVDKIFNSKQITPIEAEKLYAALEEGRSDTVFIHLETASGEEQKVIITIDPLPRPKGFFIIRGRDYVNKRLDRNTPAAPAAPLTHDPNLSATLSYMLQALPYGIYATDAEGKIGFINYRLESWLGFDQGEILANRLTLMDIVAPQNTALVDDILLRNCAGVLIFRTKDGHTVQLYVQQDVTKDANGSIIGSVSLLQPDLPANAGIASRAAVDAARQPETGADLPIGNIMDGDGRS